MAMLMPSPEPTEFEMVAGTRAALDLLAGKWTIETLYLLAGGRRRYSEVYYEVGEISKKVLTRTLRKLERHGLVERTVHAEVPPRVEYSLTPLGWSLTGPLMTIYEWSAEHLSPAVETRERDADRRRLHVVPDPRLAA
jgi:DNA-binding HxlR family transcriptional regulator